MFFSRNGSSATTPQPREQAPRVEQHHIKPRLDYSQQRPPGQSRGLLDWLRRSMGGWFGPKVSRLENVERFVTEEKRRGGPADIVMPQIPPFINDVTGENATIRGQFRLMFADPFVKSSICSKIMKVASLDLQVKPAGKKSPRHQVIADFNKWQLTRRLQGGMTELIWSVLSGGLLDGYSICGLVLELQRQGKYTGKIAITKLKPKKVDQHVILDVDEYLNVVAVQGMMFNAGEFWSPAEFIIFRHMPLFDSPTGMSDCRASYRAYWLYSVASTLRGVLLEKKAIPMLHGTFKAASQKASLETVLGLAKSQNWMSTPESVQVKVLELAGSADDVFKSAMEDLRQEMVIGISWAFLQSQQGTTNSGRGDSQVHAETADLPKFYLARCIESVLNDLTDGIIKRVTDLNYVTDEYPLAMLGSVDAAKLKEELAIYQGLYEMKVPLSMDEVREKFSVGPPDENNPADQLLMADPPPPVGLPGQLPHPGAADPSAPGAKPPAPPFHAFAEPLPVALDAVDWLVENRLGRPIPDDERAEIAAHLTDSLLAVTQPAPVAGQMAEMLGWCKARADRMFSEVEVRHGRPAALAALAEASRDTRAGAIPAAAMASLYLERQAVEQGPDKTDDELYRTFRAQLEEVLS